MTKFLDSNVIIYAFTEHENSNRCREALIKEQLATDTVVLLEAYAKLETISNKQHAEKTAQALLRMSNLTITDFDRNLYFEAVKRNKKYTLKISDLIHYTAALLSNCQSILSYDHHFDGLEIKREEA